MYLGCQKANGNHIHLAFEMTEDLLGNDEQKWAEAIDAVKAALQMRIHLWDGVYKDIMMKSVFSA